jgi:rod shape-determining protein MreB and related proteins
MNLSKFNPAKKILNFFSTDLAIDLGTANTLVYIPDKGIVLNEPSVVAIKSSNNEVLAAGKDAKEMLGKTPASIIVERPLRDGVIANFELAQSMLRYFIKTVSRNRSNFIPPRMVIGVPSGITQVELRAVKEAAKQAGAREVHIILEPMAAAIGASLPIHEPKGSMIVDIGGGTTEVAIITLKGGIFGRSVRVGGDAMDRAIVHYVKRKYNLLIGEKTAEQIKINIGTVLFDHEIEHMNAKGRDLLTGIPKTISLSCSEAHEALLETIGSILDVIKIALENTPPEVSSDLVDNGITLAGGGALLRGLDRLISKETGLPVKIADNPLLCVVMGAGKVLNDIDFYRDALMI